MSDTQVTTLDDEKTTTAAADKATGTKAKAAEAKAAKGSVAASDAGLTGNRKTIVIHQGEGAAGRDDVQVGVNGVMFNIKRGKPVDVPVEVVHVLENAVTKIYEGGEEISTPRFAFSVVSQ